MGRVLCGASCLGANCLWGELCVIPCDRFEIGFRECFFFFHFRDVFEKCIE